MAFIQRGDPRKEQCHGNIDQLRGKSKGPGKRGHIVADTLLPTQMFPRLPARVTFVAGTNFVSATNVSQFAQHGNTTFILCPARLRAQETS